MSYRGLHSSICRHISRNLSTSVPVKKPDRKMTSLELLHLKRNGKKIAMLTAYDYPSVSWLI